MTAIPVFHRGSTDMPRAGCGCLFGVAIGLTFAAAMLALRAAGYDPWSKDGSTTTKSG